MKANVKIAVVLLLAIVATVPRLFSRDRSALLEEFEFQGKRFALEALFSSAGADLQLLQGKFRVNLSAGMPGENLLLGVRSGSRGFYVFWLNHRQQSIRLAYYDSRRDSSRLLPLRDFTAIGLPQISEAGGRLRALIFLANRSGNDDIFHYELAARALTQVTHTPFSEKVFSVAEKDGQLEIETRSLWAEFRYRFNPRLRQSVLLTENRLRSRLKPAPMAKSAALDRDYCNTYIGFGDSITWGQIRIVQRLDLCYLTQMRDGFLALDYGPAQYINLGVIGDNTYTGALRVDSELEENPAMYFLLMLGFNDVWKSSFSRDSSLVILEYIIVAALARHMRVIVSTLTPRKDDLFNFPVYWNNLYALNAGIIDLAKKKDVACIDTLGAFISTNPPDGWKDLLEEPGWVENELGEWIWVKGNHPNGEGHALIASLFADALVKFPPLPPQNIKVIDPKSSLTRTAFWDPSYESDFDHFHIEFGYQPQELPYTVDTAVSFFTFSLFPFLPALDFRIQTVDRGGRSSGFHSAGTSPANAARSKRGE